MPLMHEGARKQLGLMDQAQGRAHTRRSVLSLATQLIRTPQSPRSPLKISPSRGQEENCPRPSLKLEFKF